VRLLLVGLVAVGLRLASVHEATWEWGLRPSATPLKLSFQDRDYRRGSTVDQVEAGLRRAGETSGGGVVYATSGPFTPTVIDVVDGDRVVVYELLGGP
jgi:hypothetical protein